MGSGRKRPAEATDWPYAWKMFEQWADKNNIADDHTDDWMPWWECWMSAYLVGSCA